MIPSLKIVSFQKITIKTTKDCNTADNIVISQTPSDDEITSTTLCLCTAFQGPGYFPPFIQGHFMESINFS